MTAKLLYNLWGLAEHAQFQGWRPRWFFNLLLRQLDAHHGWHTSANGVIYRPDVDGPRTS